MTTNVRCLAYAKQSLHFSELNLPPPHLLQLVLLAKFTFPHLQKQKYIDINTYLHIHINIYIHTATTTRSLVNRSIPGVTVDDVSKITSKTGHLLTLFCSPSVTLQPLITSSDRNDSSLMSGAASQAAAQGRLLADMLAS